jgi:hypothetical protein
LLRNPTNYPNFQAVLNRRLLGINLLEAIILTARSFCHFNHSYLDLLILLIERIRLVILGKKPTNHGPNQKPVFARCRESPARVGLTLVRRYTPATGKASAVVAWYDANKDRIVFDADQKKFLPSAPPTK